MTYILLIPLIAAVGVLVANAYLRFSIASTKASAKVWTILEDHAGRLMSERVPTAVREMALRMSMTTGCGCYVRALLLTHYAPWLVKALCRNRNGSDARYTGAVQSLSPQLRQSVDKFIAAVIAYDSFANPLQGFFLRRLVLSIPTQPEKAKDLPPATKEAKTAAIHAVSAKPIPKLELCPA